MKEIFNHIGTIDLNVAVIKTEEKNSYIKNQLEKSAQEEKIISIKKIISKPQNKQMIEELQNALRYERVGWGNENIEIHTFTFTTILLLLFFIILLNH